MQKSLFTLLLLIMLTPAAFGQDIEPLIYSAQNGDADAQYELSVLYQQGLEGAERDFTEAQKWRQLAAEQGHAEAQYEIGGNFMFRANSEAKPELYSEALIWYEKAAAQGHLMAKLRLADIHARGTLVPQNLPKAFEYYLAVAESNDETIRHSLQHAEAMCKTGVMYYQGVPGGRDFAKAYAWLTKAAANRNSHAEYFLNQYYNNGKIKRNPDDILTQAEQGNGNAQLEMAFIYVLGNEMAGGRNMELAEKWYAAAENQGLTNAAQAYFIGYFYDWVFENRNKAKAFEWYYKAAVMGNTEAKSALAELMTESDNDRHYDPTEAFKWQMNAAKDDYFFAYDEIADMYTYGDGVAKSPVKAWAWKIRAVQAGLIDDLFAQAELCLNGYNPILDQMYINSLKLLAYMHTNNTDITDPSWNEPYREVCAPFTMPDYAEAFKLLTLLADNSNNMYTGIAQKLLGDLYLEGKGIPSDTDKALEYYEKSAANGFFEAKFILSDIYRKGLLVKQDYVKAYVLAVEAYLDPNGYIDFLEPLPPILTEISQAMTTKQLAEAANQLQRKGLRPLQLN